MKRITWIILLLIFSLALAACGGDEPETAVDEPAAQEEAPAAQEEAPAAEPTAASTNATEAEAPEPAAETQTEAGTTVSFADVQMVSLDDLTSYRYTVDVTVTGTDAEGTEYTETMHMETLASTDPPATSTIMTSEGTADAEEMGTMEFVRTEDANYFVMGDMGCITMPAGEDDGMMEEDFTEKFSPDSVAEDLSNVTFVGKETINGIDTLHYTYDETALAGEDTGIVSVEGHIYVAEEGGYMVRSIMDMTGDSVAFMGEEDGADFQLATTHIEMNLSNVNEAVEITPPAACEGQGAAGSADWPMLEDAGAISSIAGIINYTSETSIEDAITFYDTEMAAIGYTKNKDGSFVSDGSAFLAYTNEAGEEVSVTIAKDISSDLTSVTILSDSGS